MKTMSNVTICYFVRIITITKTNNMKHLKLETKANEAVNEMIDIIKNVSLDIFNPEQTDDDHKNHIEPYDYPYGFYITKHGFCVQGNVMNIKDGVANLFLTGEDWGDIYPLPINELPIESMIEILRYIQ